MTVTEKAAYLKGLYAGLNFSQEQNEGKLFTAMIDLLEDLAISVQDLEEMSADVSADIDDIAADLTDLEDEVYGVEDECGCDCDAEYEVTCPTCGEILCVDDGVLDEGSIKCPACGEELEFDLSDLEEDEDSTDKE
ncbi:MAG: hypothetical protein N2Z65_05355 [Clostridiales bacterium]|nr:hypothetical protein [Clostridiales bacterium]